MIEQWETIDAHKASVANFPKEAMQAATYLLGSPQGQLLSILRTGIHKELNDNYTSRSSCFLIPAPAPLLFFLRRVLFLFARGKYLLNFLWKPLNVNRFGQHTVEVEISHLVQNIFLQIS